MLVSHTTEVVSSELQYIMTSKDYENVISSFELNLKGKKIKKICKLVAEMLRTINQEEYILSIFTSEIKAGKLNSVLFEIKEMKKN